MQKAIRTRARNLLALCTGLGLTSMGATGANLIENGDFANVGGVFKANTPQGGDDIQTSGGTAIPGWINVAKFVNEAWIEPGNGYSLTASPNNGSGYFVDLTGQGNSKPYGGIEQKITTVPGTGYTLSFALGASTIYDSSGSGAAALTASVTGSSVLASHVYTLSPTSANQWAAESLTFIADGDSTTIEFLGDSDNTSRYIGLDDVAVESRLLPASTTLTASPTTSSSGSAVSLTALVKPTQGTVSPAGTVQFKVGAMVLGSQTLNGTGQATLSTKGLAVGKNSITAIYSGDSIYGASTSGAVSVTVTAGTLALSLSSTSLEFGDQAAGSASPSKTVTLKNTGSATVSLSSIAVTGSQADDFTLSKSCGSSLATGASCTLSITFKPVSSGAKSAAVSITDNAGGSPQSVALGGTGTSGSSTAGIALSTTSLAFGNQSPGTASTAKTVTVTNSGTATLSLTSITLAGAQADDFTLSKGGCGSSLAAGAKCTLSVTFEPVSAGVKAATLSIADNASGSPQTIALGGTGS